MESLRWLDCTFPSPVENLAADEALLDACEENGVPGVLRFWESPQVFVVIGYGNSAAREVHIEACRADNVPILRRCSGGGAVVQAPGCLNYAVVLPMEYHPALAGITSTNRFVMERNARALGSLMPDPVSVEGVTDLVVRHLKFSGNAQRRKRRCVLFHGTFLLDFDLSLIDRYLQFPSRQPEYRQGRKHAEFVTRLELDRESLRKALQSEWRADEALDAFPKSRMQGLVTEKYSKQE